MLLDWQNWYCGNGNMTKNNPPIYCNSHQNSNDILPRARKKNTIGKCIWKHNPKQKEHAWRCDNTWPQIILRSHSNQNSVVRAQTRHGDWWNKTENKKQTHTAMGTYLLTKGWRTYAWKTVSSTNTGGKIGYPPCIRVNLAPHPHPDKNPFKIGRSL